MSTACAPIWLRLSHRLCYSMKRLHHTYARGTRGTTYAHEMRRARKKRTGQRKATLDDRRKRDPDDDHDDEWRERLRLQAEDRGRGGQEREEPTARGVIALKVVMYGRLRHQEEALQWRFPSQGFWGGMRWRRDAHPRLPHFGRGRCSQHSAAFWFQKIWGHTYFTVVRVFESWR